MLACEIVSMSLHRGVVATLQQVADNKLRELHATCNSTLQHTKATIRVMVINLFFYD